MNGDSLAAVELDGLLGHPVLAGRWKAGFTTDDVLAELMTLGSVAIDVREDVPFADQRPLRFACRLELRDETVGAIFGDGHTLTAAALRCLIEAEADLAKEVERGLGALRDLLGGR